MRALQGHTSSVTRQQLKSLGNSCASAHFRRYPVAEGSVGQLATGSRSHIIPRLQAGRAHLDQRARSAISAASPAPKQHNFEQQVAVAPCCCYAHTCVPAMFR